MAKRLIWTQFAQAQKKEIFEYWNERNGSKNYSRKLNGLFDEAAELLTTQPYMGHLPNLKISVQRKSEPSG